MGKSSGAGLSRRGMLAGTMVAVLAAACRGASRPVSPAAPTFLPTAGPLTLATAAPTPTPIDTPTSAPTPEPPPSVEPDVVEALLQSMTVGQKLGQLLLVFFEGPDFSPAVREMVQDYHVGGLVLFSAAGNVQGPLQLATTLNAAQDAAVSSGGIPLLVAVDQEGGTVVRLRDGFTVFPGAMAIGATGQPERARQAAQVMAQEMAAVGINCGLVPVLDVNSNAANPVIGLRSFGENPDAVAAMGLAFIDGLWRGGVAATAKHFPGHGDTDVDSHFGMPTLLHDRARLDAVELAPFRAAIAHGVDCVMTAHLHVPALDPTPGLPATLSEPILTGLLRQEMGFDGVIMTDSLGMGALMEQFTVGEAALRAFLAGADILAFGADSGRMPSDQKDAYAALLHAYDQGEITPEQLDASVRRILQLKADRGLLQWSPVDTANLGGALRLPESLAVADEIGFEAITLVRDDENLLPLDAGAAVTLITPTEGEALAGELMARGLSVQQLLVGRDPAADEVAGAALTAQANGSRVLVATRDAWRAPGQVALVQALAPLSPVVVALGAPYDLGSFPEVGTYLAAFGDRLPSLVGLAQVLTGERAAQGRLPVEIPGLFPRRHGL